MGHPDVLIIGGGVHGCSLAYHLAEKGCQDVLLVERQTIASGTSSKGAGGIRQQFSDSTNIQLCLYSINFFEYFYERLGLPILTNEPIFQQNGYLFLLSTEDQVTEFQQQIALQQSLGVDSRLISLKEIGDLCPGLRTDDLLAASYCPTDGYSTPPLIAQSFATQAQRLGVKILEHVEVQTIRRRGARITEVRTSKGSYQPNAVAICAGAWSGEIARLAGVEIPVEPLRRMAFITGNHEALAHNLPFVIDLQTSFYFRPYGRGFLMGMNTVEEPGFQQAVDWKWGERVLEMARQRQSAFMGTRLGQGFAGLYDMSPDGNAILGLVPGTQNLFVAAGFSGHGFMQCPAVGLSISELLLEGRASSIDITTLSPDRFALGALKPEKNVI